MIPGVAPQKLHTDAKNIEVLEMEVKLLICDILEIVAISREHHADNCSYNNIKGKNREPKKEKNHQLD